MSNEILDSLRNWTMTNLFLLTILGVVRVGLTNKGFINAYIKDNVRGVDYERGVYFLFKPKDMDDFEEFLASERARKASIIDEYDYRNGHVMVVYQYDPKWEKDINILMSGKYSKVSKEFKSMYPKTRKMSGTQKEVLSIQHSIFRKDQEYIDYWQDEMGIDIDYRVDEVWPFYPEKEIFTQEILDKL